MLHLTCHSSPNFEILKFQQLHCKGILKFEGQIQLFVGYTNLVTSLMLLPFLTPDIIRVYKTKHSLSCNTVPLAYTPPPPSSREELIHPRHTNTSASPLSWPSTPPSFPHPPPHTSAGTLGCRSQMQTCTQAAED